MRRRYARLTAALLGIAPALLANCASTKEAGASDASTTGTGGAGASFTGTGAGGTTGGGAGTTGAGGSTLPPEHELESSFEVPVATSRFVWIANPTSGRVAYVDATALTVKTVEAGNGPTYLAAIPGASDAVVVLNVLSHDATVLRATQSGLVTRPVPGVVDGANAWAVSSDGHWAIAWTDARTVAKPRPSDGFQNATVIDLTAPDNAPAATTLAVGFRPVAFSFAAHGGRAFAVTQDGVSVIALDAAGGPQVTANVPLGDDPTADVDTRDVTITADGRLAVVRREGSDTITVADLDSRVLTPLVLSGAVTDVDVTADGARAVAVVRDTAEVAIIPLGGGAPAASDITHLTITGETVGQVALSVDGSAAVLYSNAVPVERITVVQLAATPAPTWHLVRVHAPVLSAFPSADGKFAVVLHPSDDAAGTADGGTSAADAGTAPPAAGAFSLVQLDGVRTPTIQAADAPVQAVALAPGSDRALITLRDDNQRIYGVWLGLFSTLTARHYPLASPPIAAGTVPAAGRGYVAQQHPDGRITFLTLDSGDARTLTGYELAARVVDWSNP